jgi:hypothetical protein
MLLVCNLGLPVGKKVSPWGSRRVLGNGGVRRRKPPDSPKQTIKPGDASELVNERIRDGWRSYIAKAHVKVLMTVMTPQTKMLVNHQPDEHSRPGTRKGGVRKS